MASLTIDAVNAERFRLTPRATQSDPNGRSSDDGQRATFEGVGIFDVEPGPFGIQLGDRRLGRVGNDLRAVGTGQELVLSVDDRQLAAMPCQGDLVDLLERPDAPRYHIVEVRPDGQGRVELFLAR